MLVGPLPPEATRPASRSPSGSTVNSESSSLPAFATSSQAPSSLRMIEPCEARCALPVPWPPVSYVPSGESRRPEQARRRLRLRRARKVLTLVRVTALVARVLAGQRRQLVEHAPGAVAVEWAEPQLLRAARDAHVEQLRAEARGAQQLGLRREAKPAAFPRREVEREQAAATGPGEVVDDEVTRQRRAAEVAPRARMREDRGRGGIDERECTKL